VPGALAVPGASSPSRGSVPSYPSPERAVRALARAVRYAAWRRRPPSTVPELDRMDLGGARAVVEAALVAQPEGGSLDAEPAAALLAAVGIAAPHASRAHGVEVQLALHEDRSFGALVSFGVGGVATDLLGDRAYAAVPLTSADAEELISAPRAAPLLTGYGGAAPADLQALGELALRLSALGDALPEVADCRLTVRAAPHGAHVMSAAVWLAPPTARADSGPRRLRGL
jgi:hypothetical protein